MSVNHNQLIMLAFYDFLILFQILLTKDIMQKTRKVFIGGNWKCNNTLPQTQAMVTNIVDKLQFDQKKVDVIVSPIYLHLVTVLFTKKQSNVDVAAQNCSMNSFGAFTGQVAAEQLQDINIKWVILGHSQRRTHFGQTDAIVAKKVQHCLKLGLKVIFCFGQTLVERQQNKTIEVVQRQLDAIKDKITNWENVVLAYQPVWAIGTGKTATTEQVNQIHNWIRSYLQGINQQAANCRIIYGGSVTQKNCEQLIKVKNVDGFLVGGASLKLTFKNIVESARFKHQQ